MYTMYMYVNITNITKKSFLIQKPNGDGDGRGPLSTLGPLSTWVSSKDYQKERPKGQERVRGWKREQRTETPMGHQTEIPKGH